MDKRKKYNIFFAIFIISIMLFSVLGYAFKSNPNIIKYKGVKFIKNNKGIWTTRINNKQIYLLNNPKDLENIQNINIDISQLNKLNKVYITTDPSESIENLLTGFAANILPLITTVIRPACFIDINICKDLPLKDCSDVDLDTGIILIKKNNLNKIQYTNNCLIIQGNSQELQKLIDKWVLELHFNE